MTCCKAVKAACHRHQGAGWNAAPECPKGCGQAAALPSASFQVAAGIQIEGPRLQAALVPFPSLSARLGADAEFSLFERPPPALQ